MSWARMLAYITETIDQELLLRNEYLITENRILRAQLTGRVLLSNAERVALAEIGHQLGRKALEEAANTAKPDTFMGWYRRLVARKFDGAKARRYPGRHNLKERRPPCSFSIEHRVHGKLLLKRQPGAGIGRRGTLAVQDCAEKRIVRLCHRVEFSASLFSRAEGAK